MNKIIFKKLFYIIIFVFYFNTFLYNISFSTADINNSFDSDIKVFGNWKVYLINLKSDKKFVMIEGMANPNSIFRITMDKNGKIGYTGIGPNFRGWRNNLEQKGNIILTIGDRQYNLPATIVAHDAYLITYFNMPNDFIQLAQNSKFFVINYIANIPADPISLEGFNAALKYAHQLQSKADSF